MKILLGVSASIAAHRALDLASSLRKQGHEVASVFSANASRLLSPAAMEAISGQRAVVSLWDAAHTGNMDHLALTKWADAFVILPATADALASIALGTAGDALTTMALAWPSSKPMIVCPAMNPMMWAHPATQTHAETLRLRGVQILGPVHGETACRDEGVGRLIAIDHVLEVLRDLPASHSHSRPLAGRTLLITGGPTAEPLDPVRVITNPSTGKMAHALVREACAAGAHGILILGPTTVPVKPQPNWEIVHVRTAQQMHDAVLEHLPRIDGAIFAAAVSDWTAAAPSPSKLKKESLPTDARLIVELVRTPDVAAAAHKARRAGQIFVGFSAESDSPVDTALAKARRKGFDLVFANPIDQPDAGFGVDTNHGWLVEPLSANDTGTISPDSVVRDSIGLARVDRLEVQSKDQIARAILQRLAELFQRANGD